jgi:hypothetical protein
MRKPNFFWPVALILVGSVLLLINLGWLPDNIWSILWPSLLILLGISVLANAVWRGQSASTESLSIPVEEAKSADVKIEYGAGLLSVHGGSEAGVLVSGSFVGGVEHRVGRESNKANVRLSAVNANMFEFGERREWSVNLNANVPTELAVEAGAADMNFDLSQTRVISFRLQTGASSVKIRLPEKAGETRAEIHGGATSISIQVPPEVAARIRIDGGLSSSDVDQTRFPKSGNVYQSANYEKAKNKVDMRVELGAGSVDIH